METRVTEIAPDIYRCSTYLSGAGLVHNQFLIDAGEPLLFHAGLRRCSARCRLPSRGWSRPSGCGGSPRTAGTRPA
jgi:hypothetical protein